MAEPANSSSTTIDVGLAILTYAALRAHDKPTAFTVVQTYREVESAFQKVHDLQSVQSSKVDAEKPRGFSLGVR